VLMAPRYPETTLVQPGTNAAAPVNTDEILGALAAFVTWADSLAFRQYLIAESDFPLPGDLPAFLVVNQLVYRGAARPGELADAIKSQPSNMSKIVKRLEQADLVQRAADPADDRAVQILLTTAGREVARRILAVNHRLMDTVISGWDSAEVDQFTQLMTRLVGQLPSVPGT
jgi:DNA-binding MarR family transcriptional regulator